MTLFSKRFQLFFLWSFCVIDYQRWNFFIAHIDIKKEEMASKSLTEILMTYESNSIYKYRKLTLNILLDISTKLTDFFLCYRLLFIF